MAFEKNNLFIITQERDYFSSHKELKAYFEEIYIKKSVIQKLKKLNIKTICFLLYDYHKNRLYGIYEIDLIKDIKNLSDISSVNKKEKYLCFYLNNTKNILRRAIYFNDKTKHKDFLISEVKYSLFKKLQTKLNIINGDITKISLSVKMKDDYLIYESECKEPEYYKIKRKVSFSKEAYKNIYKKYEELLLIQGSEKNKKENYIELGRELCNMLLPHSDFKEYLFSSYKLIFLSLDENALKIPFEIFSFNNIFFSSVLTFSYAYSRKLPKPKTNKNNRLTESDKKNIISAAIIKLKYFRLDELDKNDKEVSLIKNTQNESVKIDIFSGYFDYFEIINFFEKYDVIHIISHGTNEGLILKDDFVLSKINSLQNPPLLVFLNSCTNSNYDNSFVKSLIDSGVKTVISGNGKIADNHSSNFAITFYENIFNKNFRIHTVIAFYFASLECDEFLRYKFNGDSIVL